MIYLTIFVSKLLENIFSTLRIIFIANNKKIIGAVLTFIISIIWILSVSFIIVDFDDYLKIICFALGSAFGSFLGNIIEEKIALGCIVINFKTNKSDLAFFNSVFQNYEKTIIKLNNEYKFEIILKRKKQNKIIKIIKNRNNKIKINIIKIFNC